jgi:hypothetical protein
LPLALLLGGCFGDIDMAPFGRRDAIGAADSLTVRRVMGTDVEAPPLQPEPGNVWPGEEAPRATLQNPDAATLQATPPESTPPRSPPSDLFRPRRSGSSTPPGVLAPLDPVPPPRAGVPAGEFAAPPAPRIEGRVIPVPGGPPAVITGGTDRIQTYTQPGVGTGTAIEQGGTTTLIGPDGQVQVVPTPR